ncbi:MAG: TerB family tellurite resistance protein [Gammaproteobacteria bacterium]
MSLSAFSNIKRLFGGSVSSDSEREGLFREALLLTLARAADADTNVRAVEVEAVRSMVQRETGDEVSDADVRVAAKSELYERAPLSAYLSQVSRSLLPVHRSAIVRCLHELIKSDRQVTVHEIDFFNQVVSALNATPAEIIGLVTDA